MKRECLVLTAATLWGSAGLARAQSFNEHFDAVVSGTGVAAPGWLVQNNSQPVGQATYFPGNSAVFPSQSTSGYLGVNYESVASAGTISNWQLTPPVLLQNSQSLVFFTRTVDQPTWPDRL